MNVKNYLKKNGIKLGVIVLVIALVVGAASYLLKGNAGLIQNVSGTVKAPVQRMVSSVAFTDIFTTMTSSLPKTSVCARS